MPNHFAIMLHHGLGDVICALPALWAADRILGPAGVFDVVVKSPLEAGVLNEIAWIGTVRSHCLSGGSPVRRVIQTLSVGKSLRNRHPQVFLAPHVASARLARMMGLLVSAPLAILPARDAADPMVHTIAMRVGEHKVHQYARYFVAAGIPISLSTLKFPPVDCNAANPEVGNLRIVLAPTVGTITEQHKRWPEPAYVELAKLIVRKWPHAAVEFFAAPNERAVLDRAYAGLDHEAKIRATVTTPSRPILAVKALKGASCVVTGCSGAAHLAAWAGVPIVGIYGPTNPGYTGAFSKKLHVIRTGWACSPCYRSDFLGGCGSPGCMTEISAADVLATISAVFEGNAPPDLSHLRTSNARHPNRTLSAVHRGSEAPRT